MLAFLHVVTLTTAPASASSVVLGGVRITALDPALVRVEPIGPQKVYEDEDTFSIVGRSSFAGVPLRQLNASAVESDTFTLVLHEQEIPTCASPWSETDVTQGVRAHKFPLGTRAEDLATCCGRCNSDESCTAWVFATDVSDGTNCWPLASFGTLKPGTPGRMIGCSGGRGCQLEAPSFAVHDHKAGGKLVYDSRKTPVVAPNLLHFPSPLSAPAYALVDFPRFSVPSWGPAPIPSDAAPDPALLPTHGYDFRNNVYGDTYVVLLGNDTGGWAAGRAALSRLIGPCPLLPDFAFGTWFTWWHAYTEKEARSDIANWEALELPIDVWALDMNWRNTSHNQDRYYDHPASPQLFTNFSEWFAFLRSKRLRTYFNDHPFPVASRGAGGLQTSPEEEAFRWNGLSEWMRRGLTYWWFDHNWAFSIPPPFVNTSITSGVWDGLDNAAWGSHVYYESIVQYDKIRDAHGDKFYGGRPIALTKFGLPDVRPSTDATRWAESPAQHRYPVWWTGDGVNLEASVHSMVDAGVHDMKPYVHSDCGGDYRGSAGDLLRWTGHCVFGTILRFHGNNHKPWSYDNGTTSAIKSYLRMRYNLLPTILAGGMEATRSAFPIAARADLFWPEHAESRSRDSYVWLNDTLVAPIYDSTQNWTSRSVWIPPGEWHDAWNGSTVMGPATLSVTQPYERIPLWHRAGGFVVTASEDGHSVRVEEQDWSVLTIEAFPSQAKQSTHRRLYERSRLTSLDALSTNNDTEVTLASNGKGTVRLTIRGNRGSAPRRAWLVRFHLSVGQRATSCTLDGQPIKFLSLQPKKMSSEVTAITTTMPFGGRGSAPPPLAGPVVEAELNAGGALGALPDGVLLVELRIAH